MTSLRALAPYAQPGSRRDPRAGDACEICAAEIADRHRHLVDRERRRLLCSCDTCAALFARSTAAGGRYRTVPDRVLQDPAFAPTASEWAALGIPVRLAFAFRREPGGWFAVYPSPAGPTESKLPEEAWRAMADRTALVDAVEADVEALLLYGHAGAPGWSSGSSIDCLLVPITVCYELVAAVRRLWRGFDGGDEVRRAVDEAFQALHARRRTLPAARRAGRMP